MNRANVTAKALEALQAIAADLLKLSSPQLAQRRTGRQAEGAGCAATL
jgi:hypothetical protein